MNSISKEIYNLTISINKALGPSEAPLKIKHARSVIITTHRTKEAKTFWTIVMRQPLMANRFSAWKFFHLLHKVLREGHESTVEHSLTHKKMILEVGKLWGHLQDGVGNCIYAYSKLIVTKLEFHEKNAQFPGSLMIDFREYEKFAGNDINVYFQLCVEIFDYLDAIIEVQSQVFSSINSYRMYSMTPQGQCRLAPLIPLIQDSNPLYDVSVRMLFKLHDKLSNDILIGHRDRFREIFLKLKNFYDLVRPLQYFADLIQVPHLPDSVPNFKSQVDFGSYIPPVMFVQPDPEPAVVNLVDTSITEDQLDLGSGVLMDNNDIIELGNKIREKDLTIQELQNELTCTKHIITTLENKYEEDMNCMREKIDDIDNELAVSKESYINVRSERDELELQVANAPTLLQKATQGEEKAKASEEKFSKLRIMYTQIRDEHIKLLRKNAESAKILNNEKLENSQLKSEAQKFKNEIQLYREDKEKIKQNNADLDVKVKALIKDLDVQKQLYNNLKFDYDNLHELNCIEKEKLNEKASQLELTVSSIEKYKETIENLEEGMHQIEKTNSSEYQILTTRVNNLKTMLEDKVAVIESLKYTHEEAIHQKKTEIRRLEEKLINFESYLKSKDAEICQNMKEKSSVKAELNEMLRQNRDLNVQYIALNAEKNELLVANENKISQLLRIVLKTIENISYNKCKETNKEYFEKMLTILEKMEEILSVVTDIHNEFCDGHLRVDGLIQTTIYLGFYYTILHEQCQLVWNTSKNIEKGEAIFEIVIGFGEPLIRIFQQLYNIKSDKDIENDITILKIKIENIRSMLNDLMKSSCDFVGLENLVDQELSDMDTAIAEAAAKFVELLSNARSKDKGIQLEVNEKILDSCTALMQSIQVLIQRSKSLQEEIVLSGKGSSSAKEFYKRNSQWTEGLLSAAKSVASGANLLVDAANKAVNGETKHSFGIIVAAQEIAACTAQLVMASKVKADRESHNLSELKLASRLVSTATGVVVATVKDCNQQLDQYQNMDFTNLNSSQVKTMEMEMHVRVLELEYALQNERYKLSTFRKNHYQGNED